MKGTKALDELGDSLTYDDLDQEDYELIWPILD